MDRVPPVFAVFWKDILFWMRLVLKVHLLLWNYCFSSRQPPLFTSSVAFGVSMVTTDLPTSESRVPGILYKCPGCVFVQTTISWTNSKMAADASLPWRAFFLVK